MKLTASMMLSLDGVYQGPGSRTEDTRGGFDRGGWVAAHADADSWPWLLDWFDRADAFLLGRRTFDIWEPYWPEHDAGDAVSRGINVKPKYVPSTTRSESAWQNTHFINGSLDANVRELKAQPGNELQVHGSGVLLRWLLERELVDELNVRLVPVVLGEGLRLFSGSSQSHDMELIESRTFPGGIVVLTYRPNGRAKLEDAG